MCLPLWYCPSPKVFGSSKAVLLVAGVELPMLPSAPGTVCTGAGSFSLILLLMLCQKYLMKAKNDVRDSQTKAYHGWVWVLKSDCLDLLKNMGI